MARSQPSLSFSAELPRPNRSATPPAHGKATAGKTRPPSPFHTRYRRHISFDNFTGGTTTTNNVVSYTLNVKHKGHAFKRESRTFMVGIDENDYSDTALNWLLEELVDDGDEIVCVTVMDKDDNIVKDKSIAKKEYQKEAMALMKRIQKKSESDQDRAIGITLEFTVGKLHTTILKMIQLYSPAMLIVGTRGRSLAGFQGLISNVNSFSKWCLQYSPVPVIVVRPPEKRLKKKIKRAGDPIRQDYARILRDSGIDDHESRGGSRRGSVFEPPVEPKVEQQLVAEAVGIDAIGLEASLNGVRKTETISADGSPSQGLPKDGEQDDGQQLRTSSDAGSEEDEETSEDNSSDAEFEVLDGTSLLRDKPESASAAADEERKWKLHQMEVNEGAVWKSELHRDRASSMGSEESQDDKDNEGGKGEKA
ncbi:Usp domain-containing protein [Calycina marina]|uniref:Usp domain-containing protein n=1 Tax=Calycina marina TaxID=1763456 RepID=A0A9P7Z7B3_9HELO|nr:Usp domain-containing protein [Calycina marina]